MIARLLANKKGGRPTGLKGCFRGMPPSLRVHPTGKGFRLTGEKAASWAS